MINKEIENITLEDIKNLIEDERNESKTLEYKREMNLNTDSEKKEFLSDVTAFANTNGGDIIFGITENKETKLPEKIEGITIQNIDEEILKIESIFRNSIEPRLNSYKINHDIRLENGNYLIIIRISKSWNYPHRVTYKGHNKFYMRNSNGKYEMDVSELRNSFNLSYTIIERIRNFQQRRIIKILDNESPVSIDEKNTKLCIHTIPFESFNIEKIIDIGNIISKFEIPMIYQSGYNHQYNFDGLVVYSGIKDSKILTYTQIFRSGILEGVFDFGKNEIPHYFEKYIIEFLKKCISFYLQININPILSIYISLLSTKDSSLTVNPKNNFSNNLKISNDNILCPEFLIDSFENIDLENKLKFVFDIIWNSFGYPSSMI